MQTHELTQGSKEWHEHRAKYFNASDAPAMMGCSPYKSRAELLHERHTGLSPEVDQHLQARFDNGHRFEALARKLAEGIIGDELYPVVGTKDCYSASFDGLTMDGTICYEHKTLNATLSAIQSADQLPEYYQVQMEQQLMVSGAKKCLFVASKWTYSDELIESKHFWYEPNVNLRMAIVNGWELFRADLASYQPPEYIPAPQATPTMDLPAVSIQIQGQISLISNLQLFGDRLNEFVENINQKPETDQDFADAEAAIKTLGKAEDALEAAMQSGLAQTASVDEMRRTVKLHKETARTTRLMLEKLVKIRKESIRTEEIQRGKDDFAEYINIINTRFGKPCMPIIPTDFAGAIKCKKSIASIKEAINTELANAKVRANMVADKIGINLNSLRDLGKDHPHLFHDTAQIVMKEADDLKALIKVRIAEYEAAEAKKAEDLRERIRQEEEAKAKANLEAEAKAKADEEAKQARIAADIERAKELNRRQGENHANEKPLEPQENERPEPDQQDVVTTKKSRIGRAATTADLVLLIQKSWGFSEGDAHALIRFAAEELTAKQAA